MNDGRTPRRRLFALVAVTVVGLVVWLFRSPGHAAAIVSLGVVLLVVEAILAERILTPKDGAVSASRSLTRLARLSLGATVLVVLSFATTIGFVLFALDPIEEESDALTSNALPSATHLATARDGLVRLHSELREYILDNSDGAERAATKLDIEHARRDVDVALGAYRALPQFSGESTLVTETDHALAMLDERIAGLFGEADLGASLAERTAKVESVLPAVERSDRALSRLEVFNLQHGTEQATAIVSMKKRSETIGLGLAGLSLTAAAVTSVLVFRMSRRQERAAELYEELHEQRAEELEAFAGRVAHDLRAPLGALSMRLAVMQLSPDLDAAQRREHVENAVRQIERTQRIIDALLEYARAGANPPPGAHAELHHVLGGVVSELEPAVQTANAELRVDDFEHLELACTEAALSSVLSNLLRNAVKYVVEGKRPERQVQVHVRDRDQQVRVEVEDSGPGLPAGGEDRAFLPLVRVGETSRPGIGLATVKRLVEAYGGHVGVRSVRGEGSVFWFEMPKARGQA